MARTSTTKSSADVVATEESVVATTTVVEENTDEEKKEKVQKKAPMELKDSDEIDVVALVPNVSYKDSKTGDMYEWDVADHVEPMTFETLKNMWRNNKGYFREMLLKPMDDRVLNKFGLTKTFEKYDFLMDESNYTRESVNEICEAISNTPNGLKFSIINKVKNLVVEGKLSDVKVIRELERKLKVDLISFLE